MTSPEHPATFKPALQPLVLAGLAGGLAEVVWIALYSYFSPLGAAQVSRQIVASVLPALTDASFAPALGIAIHLALSVLLVMLLSLAIGLPWTRKPSPQRTVLISVSALILVWAVNFLLLLPHLNPAFVQLMPYPVTLFSKLLFGLAAGFCLSRSGANPHPQLHPQLHHKALP